MAYGTTDEIKARLNIVELIGTYVRLEKAGQHWKACCPFHQERTPSFMVNEEKNMWHCFGCGKGGDVFAFVMEIEGLEFREALTLLAGRAGIELPRYRQEENGVAKESKDRIFEILELATKFYEKQLWDGAGKDKVLSYLHSRGLSDDSIKKFRLGFAPDGWRHTFDFLKSRGYSADEMEQAGLVIRSTNNEQRTANSSRYYDRFRDRVMFPIFDILGRVIGYSARVAPGGDESQAKYINTPETAVYHKSRVLYGLYQAKQAMKQIGSAIVVEGNMDVIALHQAGIEQAVAVSGTALTPEQLAIMKRYGNEVKLFFDMDGAGQKAALKSAELALEKELSVAIIALSQGKDAADMGKDNPESLRKAVAHPSPAPRYFLDAALRKYDKATPEGKRLIVDEYARLLIFMKNPIERAHWIKELARDIGVEERLILGVVQKAFQTKERQEPRKSALQQEETASLFGNRGEMLREAVIGLMYADTTVRNSVLATYLDQEMRSFFEKHPLFFFLVQSGEGDPLSLIEETELKSKAAKLSFKALASPELEGIDKMELSGKLMEIATRYLEEMNQEVRKREKLLMLERAIRDAREQGDRDLEKRLLSEFSAFLSDGPSQSSQKKEDLL